MQIDERVLTNALSLARLAASAEYGVVESWTEMSVAIRTLALADLGQNALRLALSKINSKRETCHCLEAWCDRVLLEEEDEVRALENSIGSTVQPIQAASAGATVTSLVLSISGTLLVLPGVGLVVVGVVSCAAATRTKWMLTKNAMIGCI